MFDFRKKVLHSFVFELACKFTIGLSGILIARLLGPAGKGEFTLITLVSSVVLALISSGLVISQIHLKRKYTIEKVTVNSLFIAFLAGIVSIGFVVVILWQLQDSVFKGIGFGLLVIGVTFIPMQLCNVTLRRVLQSQYDIKTYNYLNIFRPVVFLVLLVFVYLFVGRNVLWTLVIWCCSVIANFVVSFFIVRSRLRLNWKLLDKKVIKDIILYAGKVNFGGILGFFQYRIDVFIVGYFLDTAAVGYYAVGMAMAEILWRIPAAVINVLLPKLVDSSDEDANKITPRICRQMSILMLVAVCLMLIAADSVIKLLYGSAYQPSILVLRWMLPGVFFISIWKILINDLSARGYPLFYGYSTVVGVIVMITLDYFLIPSFGIVGAAVGSSIAYFCSFLMITYFYLKHTGIHIKMFLLRTSDIKSMIPF